MYVLRKMPLWNFGGNTFEGQKVPDNNNYYYGTVNSGCKADTDTKHKLLY